MPQHGWNSKTMLNKKSNVKDYIFYDPIYMKCMEKANL